MHEDLGLLSRIHVQSLGEGMHSTKEGNGIGGCQAEVKRLKAWGMGKGLAPPFQCLETPKEPGMVAKDCNPSI